MHIYMTWANYKNNMSIKGVYNDPKTKLKGAVSL